MQWLCLQKGMCIADQCMIIIGHYQCVHEYPQWFVNDFICKAFKIKGILCIQRISFENWAYDMIVIASINTFAI